MLRRNEEIKNVLHPPFTSIHVSSSRFSYLKDIYDHLHKTTAGGKNLNFLILFAVMGFVCWFLKGRKNCQFKLKLLKKKKKKKIGVLPNLNSLPNYFCPGLSHDLIA